jgi:hypothetical protein
MYAIPTDRCITWQGKVGVEGDIPSTYTQYGSTLGVAGQSPSYAQSTVTRTTIVNALSAAGSSQYVLLHPGTYTIASGFSIPSNKVLRGAGIDQTILSVSFNSTQVIRFGSVYTDRSTAQVTTITGYTKGSTSLTLASSTGWSASGYLYVDELNDTTIPVVATGGTYYGVFPGSATRCFCAIHKFTRSGTTLTIDPPAVHTFTSDLTPQAIQCTAGYTQYAGIEHLTIRNESGVAADGNVGVLWQGATNCWALSVKVKNLGKRGMEFAFDAFRNTIRTCYFQDAIDRNPSDRAYGTHTQASSFNLVENCTFVSVADTNILSSAVGNVYAYNYGYDIGRRDVTAPTWTWMSDWTHGVHNAYNLFEGNYVTGIKWDYIHGSSSHCTAFRNRLHGKLDVADGQIAGGTIITEQKNWRMNEVGNILGLTGWSTAYELIQNANNYSSKPIFATGIGGDATEQQACWSTKLRHMNYNYYTNTLKIATDTGEPGVQGGDADTALPNSLYMVSRPVWYGGWIWPPIDPSGPTVNTIPAKALYDGTPEPGGSPPVGTPVLSVR